MKKTIFFCSLWAICILLEGCGGSDDPPSVIKEREDGFIEYDMSSVETRGRFSFLPLNLEGIPSRNTSKILGALHEFSQRYPGDNIVPWGIETRKNREGETIIKGIWVVVQPGVILINGTPRISQKEELQQLR